MTLATVVATASMAIVASADRGEQGEASGASTGRIATGDVSGSGTVTAIQVSAATVQQAAAGQGVDRRDALGGERAATKAVAEAERRYNRVIDVSEAVARSLQTGKHSGKVAAEFCEKVLDLQKGDETAVKALMMCVDDLKKQAEESRKVREVSRQKNDVYAGHLKEAMVLLQQVDSMRSRLVSNFQEDKKDAYDLLAERLDKVREAVLNIKSLEGQQGGSFMEGSPFIRMRMKTSSQSQLPSTLQLRATASSSSWTGGPLSARSLDVDGSLGPGGNGYRSPPWTPGRTPQQDSMGNGVGDSPPPRSSAKTLQG